MKSFRSENGDDCFFVSAQNPQDRFRSVLKAFSVPRCLRGEFARARRPCYAFTIVEILVVIVIIVTLSGLMVPVFYGALEGSRERGSLDRVTSLMTLAQSTAVSDGHPVRLNFDEQRGFFFLTQQPAPLEEPGVFVPLDSTLAETQLDESLRIRTWQVEGAEEREAEIPWITFRPDGTAERALIVLESKSEAAWSLQLSPLSGLVRVLPYDVTEEQE